MKGLLTPGALIRLGLTVLAAAVLWFGIDAWIADRTSITLAIGPRPIDLLSPQWLHLLAVIPAFYVIRVLGGVLYLSGMLIMAWNVVMTMRSGKVQQVLIPAVPAHA